ncbi:MAG TPA: DUF4270 family protein [Ohtaekwangia sp.]|uniref:DUF4270 family protein n=1 Tax=Ohtaekwangia sp. TaxID=2066019 RepID=UPI002F932924
MNLRAKRVGQLAIVAVALFFFSCEDGTSLLGYENPTSKFNLSFVDIPVESSVMLLDSIRTSNYNASNDLNRLLVGKVDDARFGNSEAIAIAQFMPTSALDTSVTNHNPTFDSISLSLRHDFYAYGASGNTRQEIFVHELTDQLKSSYDVSSTTNTGGQQKPYTTTYSFQKNYFTSNTTAYDPTALASKQFFVDQDKYDLNIADATPDTIVTQMRLADALGQRLLNLAVTSSATDFLTYNYFTEKFKGLAFVPGQSDKVIGLRPNDNFTRMVLYYHTTKDTLAITFTVGTLISYSKITTDRSASELSSLTTKYQEAEPNGDVRYVQAGSGVVTKLDLSKFNEFAATLDRAEINSAELMINGIDDPGNYTPPSGLVVKIVKDNNRFKKLSYQANGTEYTNDIQVINSYKGYINFDRSSTSSYYAGAIPFDSTLNIIADGGRFFTLNYASDTKKYKGAATLFFQQLLALSKTETEPKFTSVVLVPYEGASSSFSFGRHVLGKTINRVAFNKNNIVLRVYYTVPTVN